MKQMWRATICLRPWDVTCGFLCPHAQNPTLLKLLYFWKKPAKFQRTGDYD